MNKPKPEWALVTRIDAGKVLQEDLAVMLRFHFQRPATPGTPPAPEQTTLPLYLTERQAKDLLLLVGHALGFPGTGISDSPPTPKH